MSIRQHLPVFIINIGDQPASEALMDAIDEIVVDTSLHQPDMVTIRLHDPARRWLNDEQLFAFATPLIIEVIPTGEPDTHRRKLIAAEITGLEADFRADGMTGLLLRGYHRTNRLHLGLHSRTFANRKDSDIVKAIADEIGLGAEVDDTEVEHEYVLQNNQTNWAFLAMRAARIGYQLYAVDQTLFFKKPTAQSNETPVSLTLGDELRHFQPHLSVMHQSAKVRVYGWDAKGKRTLVGNATPDRTLNQGGITTTGGEQAQRTFDQASHYLVVDRPVASAAEANALAQGIAADIERNFLEAEGVCRGNPLIKAGCKIRLNGLGTRFDGNYFVTSALHRYNAAGYTVEFTVSGRQPTTLHHLLGPRNGHPMGANQSSGVVVGLVTNLNDPEQAGRVKVKYPWLWDDGNVEIESAWAKVCAPMAGQDGKGFFALPEVDDEVLIAFEQGDVNHPYLLGVLWNTKDRPPKPQSGDVLQQGKVMKRILRSRVGHEIVFDDSADKPSLILTTKGGHKLALDDTTSAPHLSLVTGGGHKIVLADQTGGETIQVVDKTGGNIIQIDSVTNSISLKATADLRLEAGGRIVLVGQTGIAISAPTGGSFEADGPLTIKSSSALNLQGGIVKIN